LDNVKDFGPIYGSLLLECGSTCLVSCIDDKGVPNIITCSAVFPVQPGYVSVTVGFTRHSHDLIKKGGDFAVNLPSRDLYEAVMFCGSRSGRHHKKFEECHLTPKRARKIKTPVIGECVAWIECENYSSAVTHDHTIFVGKVVSAYAREDAVDILFDPKRSLNKWGLLRNYSVESSIKRACERTGADFNLVKKFWRRYYELYGEHWFKP